MGSPRMHYCQSIDQVSQQKLDVQEKLNRSLIMLPQQHQTQIRTMITSISKNMFSAMQWQIVGSQRCY